ncbi:MAG: Ig-like domain-containing protein [Nitrosomonas sp.]|uniref:Ig-like domain-containing protein n=1 Tax=Nitrosomonas sp. TaxID=42353 RepID=UPI0025FFAFD6|nr:Ig-like domain-containing protein [Nitrosomonas sp.]UJP02392.1 MAG: Ig-like domain-containing protein [Nitrosomonas sp.]UJP08297.1 MAG: Ig-like domain-containing protein [Nitrosomonas sp.]
MTGNSVIINPAADLIPDTNYRVPIPAGTITDTTGNAFAGSGDPSGFSFTPVESNPALSGTNFMASDGQPFLPVSFLWNEQLRFAPEWYSIAF